MVHNANCILTAAPLKSNVTGKNLSEFENILDIQIAGAIRDKLDSIFADNRFSKLQVIAEPGRYFAEKSFSLVVNVIAKKGIRSVHFIQKMSRHP